MMFIFKRTGELPPLRRLSTAMCPIFEYLIDVNWKSLQGLFKMNTKVKETGIMSGIFEQSRLLSVAEVAQVLGVKSSTVLSWVHEKRIPCVKFGLGKKAPLRFNPKALNRWIAKNSREVRDKNQLPGYSREFMKIKKASHKTIEDFDKFVEKLV